VEHAYELEQVQPWRTAAIVASGIAAIELVFLIVAGVVLLARPITHHGASAASHRAKAAPAATAKPKPKRPAVLARARTRVIVLNGNGETGAAATEADAIKARGYKISAVGNAPQAVTGPSFVMYRPGFAAEAKRLARDTGLGIVTALDGMKTSRLHRAQLVIVLGSGSS
jgi:hypothetical protein